ncbi:MAG: DNA polymerase III subunit gamma/tau [Alphaproteobacteria bacterium]|nr:DNA polymerase III subunit gamma/tau [Alphaproteobacteria bacterium]
MVDPTPPPYRVLARKYRPTTLAGLVGQDVAVRTLGNAFASGRIAQAYLLTGVRGVGKTTTARIIARGLNCIDGPTAEPCGVCVHCRAIGEDRHLDVLEMDAASRTGIDNIRELLDGARYLPTSARYKVYIIDEVHMLSEKAFNALLKTLEEPPPHVRFVFATTEIRRVPITVLSRCQRFDLRRVDAEVLVKHFAKIAADEGVGAEPEALSLIARAADGSVRDGLSLLDQAIAHGDGTVAAATVRAMLGLGDRAAVYDLFEHLMAGAIAKALAELQRQYGSGADPLVVLQDLLELTHGLTRLKVAPDAARTGTELERVRGAAMAERLPMPVLARAWQMLLKGLGEARLAPSTLAAAEMVLVRLAYVADLPTPGELVRTLAGEAAPRTTPDPRPAPGARTPEAKAVPAIQALVPEAKAAPAPAPVLANFADVVALAEARREAVLAAQLRGSVRPVRFEDGRIEIQPTTDAPPRLANDLAERLRAWTGRQWFVTIAPSGGGPTLREEAAAASAARLQRLAAEPLVAAVLAAFPGARIDGITPRPEGPREKGTNKA